MQQKRLQMPSERVLDQGGMDKMVRDRGSPSSCPCLLCCSQPATSHVFSWLSESLSSADDDRLGLQIICVCRSASLMERSSSPMMEPPS